MQVQTLSQSQEYKPETTTTNLIPNIDTNGKVADSTDEFRVFTASLCLRVGTKKTSVSCLQRCVVQYGFPLDVVLELNRGCGLIAKHPFQSKMRFRYQASQQFRFKVSQLFLTTATTVMRKQVKYQSSAPCQICPAANFKSSTSSTSFTLSFLPPKLQLRCITLAKQLIQNLRKS